MFTALPFCEEKISAVEFAGTALIMLATVAIILTG